MALIMLDGRTVPELPRRTPEEHQDGDGPGNVLLDLRQWRETMNTGVIPEGVEGIVLHPEDTLTDLIPWLGRLNLLALHFPKAGDGRPYSMARQLRGRYGYHRELRAVGDVRADQLDAMRRCGFSSFVLSAGDPATPAMRYLQGPRAYPHWQDPAAIPG